MEGSAEEGSQQPAQKKISRVQIPYHVLDYSDNRFTDEERNYLNRQLKSVFAFVGCAVPDTVDIGGEPVPLREIVWTIMSRESHTEEQKALARSLAEMLDLKVGVIRRMIAQYDLTDAEAESLYFEACGLLKALVTLRQVDRGQALSPAEAHASEKIADARRLLDLINKIK